VFDCGLDQRTFGVRRLGDLLHERFGVEHLWINKPNLV
jgi:hypothetical protein